MNKGFCIIYILIYVNGTGSGATYFENTLAKVSIFFLEVANIP